MENTNTTTSDKGINRRSVLKAGLLLGGAAILPTACKKSGNGTPPAPDEGSDAPDRQVTSRRRLGRTLEVSGIGLGVQNMPRTYQGTVPSRPEMINIIRTAYDRGVTLFDTAEAYGPWESERILGEAVASFRDNIVIETKFGWNINQNTGQQLSGLNSRPEQIKLVVENMLQRLRTDRIDLLYQHRVDPNVPIEEVVGAIQDLIREGKVLHYGLSEPGPQTVRRAHAIHPVTAIQNEYSLLWRGPENVIIPLCEELGIGFVCWSPLGVGFLTGTLDANTRFAPGDLRGSETRFSPANLQNNMALVDLIRRWATQKEARPSEISLAWLMAQKPWIVPIPGTTQMAHMLENIGGDRVLFSASELRQFNTELSAIVIQGERLPSYVEALSGVEAPTQR